jgi:hypothetical protein
MALGLGTTMSAGPPRASKEREMKTSRLAKMLGRGTAPSTAGRLPAKTYGSRIKHLACAALLGLGASLTFADQDAMGFPGTCANTAEAAVQAATPPDARQADYTVYYMNAEHAHEVLQAQGFSPEAVNVYAGGMWIMVLNPETTAQADEATGPSAEQLAQFDDNYTAFYAWDEQASRGSDAALASSSDLNQTMAPSAAGPPAEVDAYSAFYAWDGAEGAPLGGAVANTPDLNQVMEPTAAGGDQAPALAPDFGC